MPIILKNRFLCAVIPPFSPFKPINIAHLPMQHLSNFFVSAVMWASVSGHLPHILYNGETSCFYGISSYCLFSCCKYCALSLLFWAHSSETTTTFSNHPCSHLLLTPLTHAISSLTILVCADDIPHSTFSGSIPDVPKCFIFHCYVVIVRTCH